MSRRKQFTEPRTPLQVRVSPSVKKELKKLAESEKRTLNNYLVIILEGHIQRERAAT